jgi:lipopolysaccharide export system protein LptA
MNGDFVLANVRFVSNSMTSTGLFAVVLATIVLVGASAVAEQGWPNALGGFSSSRDKPVRIQAASLEVREKEKIAIFSGDVHVVQGDTDMRCKVLVVYYEESASKGAGPTTAQPGPAGSSQIRRMEARGNVVMTQKDQIATSDGGDFDMRNNTVTLSGNVVVTKGQDVMRGERLVVNLTDGVSKMDSGGRPVDMLVMPPLSEDKSGQGQFQNRLPPPARKK